MNSPFILDVFLIEYKAEGRDAPALYFKPSRHYFRWYCATWLFRMHLVLRLTLKRL